MMKHENATRSDGEVMMKHEKVKEGNNDET